MISKWCWDWSSLTKCLHFIYQRKQGMCRSNKHAIKVESKTLLVWQFERGLKSNLNYLATIGELNNGEYLANLKESIPEIIQALQASKDVMWWELLKKLHSRREIDHQIELEPNTKPPAMVLYWMIPSESVKLWKQLQDLLELGYIYTSKALFGASVLFQKKDGSFCICIDYQAHTMSIGKVETSPN